MKTSDDVDVILNELAKIMYRKHKDYGPKNIAEAPGGPMNGLRVRMYDKLARLNNLIDTGDTPNYESIEDTLIDLANYAIIGLLVQRGQWEGVLNGAAKQTDSGPERPTDSVPRQPNSRRNTPVHKKLQTRRTVVRGG
jgi:hypothetical protein